MNTPDAGQQYILNEDMVFLFNKELHIMTALDMHGENQRFEKEKMLELARKIDIQ